MHSVTPADGNRWTVRLIAAIAVLVTLVGCSVRLDTPPPEVPTPDAAEQSRAALAGQTETLATLASAAAGSADGQVGAELTALADASQEHLSALGGMWSPPPRPDDPSPTPVPEPTATAEDVQTALAEATEQVQEAIDEPFWDAETATLLASIALYRDGAAARLAEALGTGAPEPVDQTTELPAALDAASTGLCRTLDGLGYAYEVQAARSGGDERDRAVRRAERDRALAEQVAVLAGYDGTEDDPRQVSYAVGDDLSETIATWRGELVPAWLALVGPATPEDRVVVLTQLRAAAALAPPSESAFPGLQEG